MNMCHASLRVIARHRLGSMYHSCNCVRPRYKSVAEGVLLGRFHHSRIPLPTYYPATLVLSRQIHTTFPLGAAAELPNQEKEKDSAKPSSKVEQTVKVLEQQIKYNRAEKRPLYKRIQDEILHYYHGFRLLLVDIKISSGLIWRVLNGKTLSRREYKQLIRTTSDLFRLVPFSVFIIIPFMELLLPVFLKLFPGMLPSTFTSTKDRESNMKAELKVKLEMAKFLQQTLDDMAPQAKGRSSQVAKEFAEFIDKIRTSGNEVPTAEIIKYSKLFEDEITLDSLSRQQLMALCRVIEIPAIGTSAMLRFQLRMRMRNLIADDKVIEQEGIDALDLQELQNACKARGMRAIGMPEDRLKRQLRQWLTLTLHQKVPYSLLLLTRTMYLPENLPAPQQLQATLQSLPDATTLQTKAAIGEREGKIDNKTRIELIKEEERKIQEERLEARSEAKHKEAVTEAKKEMEEELALVTADGMPVKGGKVKPWRPDEEDKSLIASVNRTLMKLFPGQPGYANDLITPEDIDEIEHVISTMDKGKKLAIEKEEIKDLKAEINDYIEDVRDLETISERARELRVKVKESKGARRLLNRLNTMITKLDRTVALADAEEMEKKAVIQKNLVATSELISAVRKSVDVRDPAKLERIAAIFAKLDDDKDGKIEVDDLVKVIDIVGKEHVNLSSKQLEDLVGMLSKEEMVELKRAEKERASAVPK